MKRFIVFVVAFVLSMGIVSCCAETPTDTALTLGDIDGAYYTNQYLGLGCRLEGWHYYSASEIAQLNSQELENLPDNLEDFVREKQSMILMFAETEDKMQNVTVSTTYLEGLENMSEQMGMKMVVESLYDQIVSLQTLLGRENAKVSVISDSISNETFYGYDIVYEYFGSTIYQRQVMLSIKDYAVALTASGASTEETENIIHSFFYLDKGDDGQNSEVRIDEQSSGSVQRYVGKLRPVNFEVPNEWKQQMLSQDYSTLEAKFVDQESRSTMIQYACQDLISSMTLPESMRSIMNTESYTTDDIKTLYESMLSDQTVNKTKIGDLDCFVVRGTYGFPVTFVIFIENGYLHQFGLYETNSDKIEEHEKILFDVAASVRFSDQ